VARMVSFARRAGLSEQVQSLLAVIHDEATLGCTDTARTSCADQTVQQLSDDAMQDAPTTKRSRQSSSLDDSIEHCSPVNTESGSSFSATVQETSVAKCSSAFQNKDVATLRPVTSSYSRGPMFYYCPYRRRLKNVNIPK